MSKRIKILVGVSTVALVAGLSILPSVLNVRSAGETLRIDTSTPRAQTGFTAIDVDAFGEDGQIECHWPDTTPYVMRLFRKLDGVQGSGQPDIGFLSLGKAGIGIWVLPSWQPNVSTGARFPATSFTCSGRASTGTPVPVEWQEQMTSPARLIVLTFPLGYPDTFRFIDVSVKDTTGHFASWRLTGLPKMLHLVPAAASGQNRFQFANFTLKARAWKQPARQIGVVGIQNKVDYATDAWIIGKPTGTGAWDIEQHAPELEWGPRPAQVQQTGSGDTMVRPGPNQESMTEVGGFRGLLEYPEDTHWLRLPFVIYQFDFLDEVATFHDLPVRKAGNYYTVVVPKTLSFTTPTGITVRLLAPDAASRKDTSYGQENSVYCRLDLVPTLPSNQLSRSPLVRRYNAPLLVRLVGAKPPIQLLAWDAKDSINEARFLSEKPIGNTIPTLSFVIRQRCNLQTLPAALTIPIEAKRPTELHL